VYKKLDDLKVERTDKAQRIRENANIRNNLIRFAKDLTISMNAVRLDNRY